MCKKNNRPLSNTAKRSTGRLSVPIIKINTLRKGILPRPREGGRQLLQTKQTSFSLKSENFGVLRRIWRLLMECKVSHKRQNLPKQERTPISKEAQICKIRWQSPTWPYHLRTPRSNARLCQSKASKHEGRFDQNPNSKYTRRKRKMNY